MLSMAIFLPLALVMAMYASFLKLAARILRFRGVTWVRTFVFAALLFVLSMLVRGAIFYFEVQLPALIALSLGTGLHLFFGAWFFRARALGQDGQVVGWSGGAKLTAIAMAFLFLVVISLMAILLVLLPFVEHS